MDPFEIERLAHQLVEIGTRLQAAAFALATRLGHPSDDELTETCDRTARAAIQVLDRFKAQLPPAKRTLPWP
jgi:hypothetical protein